MTTERELLELAAQAAGAEYEIDTDGSFELLTPIGGVSGSWNPAHDSADGAELEAALGLDVYWKQNSVDVVGSHGGVREFYADHGGNKQKARMWATLRAAADVQRRKG